MTNAGNIWLFGLAVPLIVSRVYDASAWSFTSPYGAFLHQDNATSVAILFHGDVPLDKCQCAAWLSPADHIPLLEFSSGTASPRYLPKRKEDGVGYRARYHGTGLENGDCGVAFVDYPEGSATRVVVCRARAEGGGWLYQHVGTARNSYNVSFTPTYLVQPGTSVNILFAADTKLWLCNIRSPEEVLLEFPANATPQGRFSYHGAGLADGQCGVTIGDARKEDNGVFWGVLHDVETRQALVPSILIVAEAPSALVLALDTGTTYREGTTLRATCTVGSSRPTASITWHLGDRLLRQDSVDDTLDPDPHWPWDKQILSQTLRYNVTVGDNGLALKCRARHPSVPNYRERKRVITVLPADDNLETRGGSSACGKRVRLGVGLVAGGSSAGRGDFPYHAGIYKVAGGGGREQKCGGTLVTPTLVISAAHCFWDKAYTRLHNSTEYSVSLGKVLRDWSSTEDGEQKIDVKAVHVQRQYAAHSSTYEYDIAVVELAVAAVLTDTVDVACVDWTRNATFEDLQLTSGSHGTAVGWGTTLNDLPGDVLQAVSLPWIPQEVCYDAVPKPLRYLITSGKFCAGYRNRSTSVCQGDSGGGLLFLDEGSERYFLRGIVSTSFQPRTHLYGCFAQQYTSFTRLSRHINWVNQYR